jgi:hypothetical protein
VQVSDLMAWNGLNETSIIHPDEKLVLQVTPPATTTPTPGPATATATATPVLPTLTATPTQTPTQAAIQPTSTIVSAAEKGDLSSIWLLGAGLAVVGLVILLAITRKKR